MVLNSLEAYGYEPDPNVVEAFSKYRKTHNEGVFDAYTENVRKARSSHVLTGLPDAYGRGRIIGDYRRVALYGVDRLIERKKEEKEALDRLGSTDEIIRDREELSDQIRALGDLKEMASKYGFDISRPAESAKEAVQWLYFGYLGAVKDQNGAAMRQAQHRSPLVAADRVAAPGDLDQWGQQEGRCRIGGNPEMPHSCKQVRIVDLQLVRDRGGNLVERRLLAQLFDQKRVLVAKIVRFHRFFAVAQGPFVHHLTVRLGSCRCRFKREVGCEPGRRIAHDVDHPEILIGAIQSILAHDHGPRSVR